MKTTISLPDHLFERAESVSQRLGMTRTEIHAKALRAYLEHHDAAAQRRALDAL